MRKSISYGLSRYRALTGRGNRTATIIIDYSKFLYLVKHDRPLTKIAATGVDLMVVVWVKEFPLGLS